MTSPCSPTPLSPSLLFSLNFKLPPLMPSHTCNQTGCAASQSPATAVTSLLLAEQQALARLLPSSLPGWGPMTSPFCLARRPTWRRHTTRFRRSFTQHAYCYKFLKKERVERGEDTSSPVRGRENGCVILRVRLRGGGPCGLSGPCPNTTVTLDSGCAGCEMACPGGPAAGAYSSTHRAQKSGVAFPRGALTCLCLMMVHAACMAFDQSLSSACASLPSLPLPPPLPPPPAQLAARPPPTQAMIRPDEQHCHIIACDVTKFELLVEAIGHLMDPRAPDSASMAPHLVITSAGMSTPGYFLSTDLKVAHPRRQYSGHCGTARGGGGGRGGRRREGGTRNGNANTKDTAFIQLSSATRAHWLTGFFVETATLLAELLSAFFLCLLATHRSSTTRWS